MPAQYPQMAYVADSQTVLLRKLVNNTALIAAAGGGGITWVTPPTSASDPGTAGDVAYDESYFYVCYLSGQWLRTPLSSW